MDKSKTNKARDQLVKMFLSVLEEDKKDWKQGWTSSSIHINPITNKNYKGMNYLQLNLTSYTKGYIDPRWCTFKQADKAGWKIKKGEHGTPIEFWSLYDKSTKKTVTIREYNYILQLEGPERKEDFIWMNKTSTVFNASQIEGMPELIKNKNKEIKVDGFVSNLVKNMNIEVFFGLEACYSPKKDKIYMPPKENFHSTYGYNATLLHELSHATSHESRLNREISSKFGSVEYAKEELRAEIASAFISSELNIGSTTEYMENHAAYVSSWIEVIKKDQNELFRAIKDATDISEYMFNKGELELYKEEEIDIQEETIENESLESLHVNKKRTR